MPVYDDLLEAENGMVHCRWASDGSTEGFCLVSFRKERISFYRTAVNALFEICQGNEAKADDVFLRLLKTFRADELSADLIKAIGIYRDDLSCRSLMDYALKTMKQSDCLGMIKIALIIVSGFYHADREVKEAVRILSHHPDLCWYCFRIMALWKDGERLIREAVNPDYLWSVVHGIHQLDCSDPISLGFIFSLLRKRPDAALLCAGHICCCAYFPAVLRNHSRMNDVLVIGLLMEIYSYGNALTEIAGFKETADLICNFAKENSDQLAVLEILAFMLNRNVLTESQRERCSSLLLCKTVFQRLLYAENGYEYIELGKVLKVDFDQLIIQKISLSEHPADLLVFIKTKEMMNKAVEIIAAKGFDEKEALVILSALRRFPAAGTGFLKACLKMNYGIRKAVRELLEIWLENDLCMDEDIGEIMKMAAVGAKEVLS